MAYILIDNPDGCLNKDKLKDFDSCRSCYFSQTNEKNQWIDSLKCYNEGNCLVYGLELPLRSKRDR